MAAGRGIDDVEQWPERIAAMTVERVVEAATAVFVPERSTTAILRPKPSS
jgi:zinc protease